MGVRRWLALGALSVLGAMPTACGDEPTTGSVSQAQSLDAGPEASDGTGGVAGAPSCVDGAFQSCVCPGGAFGVQRCSFGSFGPCACASDLCGNGVIDAGEMCDGSDLGVETCASATMDFRPMGTLRCSSSCTLDTSGCTAGSSLCGNGVIDRGEVCDTFELGGATCSAVTMGATPYGTLRCSRSCTFDTTACSAVMGASGGTTGGGGMGAFTSTGGAAGSRPMGAGGTGGTSSSGTGGTTPSPNECIPGRSLACAGPGACDGTQICRDDGTFGPCECASSPGDAGAAGAAGADADPDTTSGCSCAAVGAENGPSRLGALLAAGVLAFASRRRHRRSTER